MSRDYRLILVASLLTTLSAAIAGLAVSLVATTVLHAGSLQMGWLVAFELAPFALLALPAGPWLDRTRKKPVAVVSYSIAAVAALGIPLATADGWLSMELLYALGFVQGTSNVIGGTALQILLLQIVGRDGLLAANSRLNASQSAISVAGVLLAGLVVIAQGPAVVLLASSLFLFAAVMLVAAIDTDIQPPPRTESHLWREVATGLLAIRDTPMLRALVTFGALWLMLIGGFGSQVVLFATRDLGFSAAQWSGFVAVSSVGASLGALAARRYAERSGVRAALLAGFLVTGIAMGLYPVALWLGGAAFVFALCIGFFRDFGIPLYTVNYISLRQRIVPDDLLGRVIGAMRGIAVSAAPVGALIWSHVADRIGIAPTMYLIGICGVGLWWVAAWRMPRVTA